MTHYLREIGHGESIYITEVCEHYKLGLPSSLLESWWLNAAIPIQFLYYLELVQTSQAKCTLPNKDVLTSDASHKSGGSQCTHTSDQLMTNMRVPMTLSGLIIL